MFRQRRQHNVGHHCQGFSLIEFVSLPVGEGIFLVGEDRAIGYVKRCIALEFDIGFNLLAGDKDVPDPGFTIGARDVGGFVKDLGLAFAHGPAAIGAGDDSVLLKLGKRGIEIGGHIAKLFLLRAACCDQVLGDVFSLLVADLVVLFRDDLGDVLNAVAYHHRHPAHPDHVVVEVVG